MTKSLLLKSALLAVTVCAGCGGMGQSAPASSAESKRVPADQIESAPATPMAGAPIAPASPTEMDSASPSAPSSKDQGGPPQTAGAGTEDAGNHAASRNAAQAEFDRARAEIETPGRNCQQLCRALTSMRNAAEQLCALNRPGNTEDARRCQAARRKVASAEAEVTRACNRAC